MSEKPPRSSGEWSPVDEITEQPAVTEELATASEVLEFSVEEIGPEIRSLIEKIARVINLDIVGNGLHSISRRLSIIRWEESLR